MRPSARVLYRVVYSGIQPTGVLHLGNYLGAVRSWVQMQNEPSTKLFISIADLHSITTGLPRSSSMRKNILEMAACLLACGIDPDRTVLFQQSRVPHHAELAWIIGATVTLAQLQGQSQFKAKSRPYQRTGNVPLGLVTYPVLQAADILLYKATHVPVGRDQRQHLEMTTRIARNTNIALRNNFFPEPQAMYSSLPSVRSLRDPTEKMSKSDASVYSRIDLTDTPKMIHRKLKRALTDNVMKLSYDPVTRFAVSSLIDLHSAVTDVSPDSLMHRFGHMNKQQYKTRIADDIIELLSPMRRKYVTLMRQPEMVCDILDKGAETAQMVAKENMRRVRELCGFDLTKHEGMRN